MTDNLPIRAEADQVTIVEIMARAICRQCNIDDGYRDSPTLTLSINMGMWLNHAAQAQSALDALSAEGLRDLSPTHPRHR